MKPLTVQKVLFSWSTGKDSALALYRLQQKGELEISALLTTVTEEYDRVSIHGVNEILLDQQANAIGLELEKLFIPKKCSNDDYERLMRQMLEKYSEKRISATVFGDIFLENLKEYRTEKLSLVNMDALFPLWGRDTNELAEEFIALGFKAIVTCVDTEFLDELPDSVDPCGENGEFHTFAYEGPIFSEPIPYRKGRIVLREERFSYCDLVPLQNGQVSDGEI